MFFNYLFCAEKERERERAEDIVSLPLTKFAKIDKKTKRKSAFISHKFRKIELSHLAVKTKRLNFLYQTIIKSNHLNILL